MVSVRKALGTLGRVLKKQEIKKPVSFQTFLEMAQDDPDGTLRTVFQVFHDMIRHYVPGGTNEYPNDPESIGYIKYDTYKLLVDGHDTPFFADRLFANRFVNHVEAFQQGVLQNHIYLFEGPPGSGKSTFLNNLLARFQEFSQSDEGSMYETIWRLNIEKLGGLSHVSSAIMSEKGKDDGHSSQTVELSSMFPDEHLMVPCPSHDHPILHIPKKYRKEFLRDVIENPRIMEELLSVKEYEWIFKAEPCTICRSIFQALVGKLGSHAEAYKMLFARRYVLDRQKGEGISVYNPGDEVIRNPITNPVLQNLLNNLFRDSNAVRYVYSRLAKTNNGIFAVMDIKNFNKDRILNLHGIISDEVHKVEYIEETISSLFIAILNPQDMKVLTDIKSYEDRIVRIRMPYVLDYHTEVEIYRNLVDANEERFLPRIAENFAKVIISTRLKPESPGMKAWISDPDRYTKMCDKNLLLLKMDIYTGYIPSWVHESDLKNFDARKRRKIIGEGELEGDVGISGRQSIQLFIDFCARYAQGNNIVTMENLANFFKQQPKSIKGHIPAGFIDSLNNLYAFDVLQEVKEALYNYNQDQIDQDVKSYLSAISFETGTTIKSPYTNQPIEVTDSFFAVIEHRLLGPESSAEECLAFRERTHREYISNTLAREIVMEGKKVEDTKLYKNLHGRYTNRLKDNVLDPLVHNESFRLAIKEFGAKEFQSHDQRIKQDVQLLFKNLQEKFNYTESGAQRVCIYVLDNKLVERFANEVKNSKK